MYKYTYSNLPFEYLSYHYSLWVSEDKFYIYLFSTQKEMFDKIKEISEYAHVAMDINLKQELNYIKYNNEEYIILLDYIKRTKNLIENIPEFSVFEELIITKKIKHTEFDINVEHIINEIKKIYVLYSQDYVQLQNLLSNLKIKIDYCKYTDSVHEEFIKVTEDKIYMFIDIKIVNEYLGCNLFKCKKTQSKLSIIYLLAKPENINANKLCTRLMNTRMINKVNYLKMLTSE